MKSYPKAPNLGVGSKSEETGSVYLRRQELTASPETRRREVMDNDYGLKPRPLPERGGMPVSPRRTIITAS
jgi:hypothetical protein